MSNPITKQQVDELKATNKVVRLLDVRSSEEYETMHIQGITHIPAQDLPTLLDTFDKNDTIVCVCNHGGNRSQSAAAMSANAGFDNSFFLEGGTVDWLASEK